MRRSAWIAIVLADAGFLAWGVMAALALQSLPGPGGRPILIAGYEGFTNGSWSELVAKSPMTAEFIELVFRLFGALCATFGLLGLLIAATAFRRNERWAWWALLVGNTLAYGAPMTYDRLVNAIGVFELSEYLGIAIVYLALAITAGVARSPSHVRDARRDAQGDPGAARSRDDRDDDATRAISRAT